MSKNKNLKPSANTLCVTLLGGRNFSRQTKTNEWTDKFCIVRIGDLKQKSIVKTSHQGKVDWGDTLQFNIEGIPPTEQIIVTVYVQWSLSNEMIGETRFQLGQYKDIPRRFALEHWYPFGTGGAQIKENPLDTKSIGELGLIIGVFEGDPDERIDERRQIRDVDDPYYENLGADEIYLEANETAKENKQAVDRITKVAESARDTGVSTLATLEMQSEKLQQAEDDVEIIHQQVTVGERKLKSIESCFCCCFAGCCGDEDEALKKELKKQSERAEEAERTRTRAKQTAAIERSEMDRANYRNKKGAVAARQAPKYKVKNEILSQEQEFEKNKEEIDQGLDHLSDVVSDMKQIAIKMGEEIEVQTKRIENIETNAEIEAARIHRATERTKKLI